MLFLIDSRGTARMSMAPYCYMDDEDELCATISRVSVKSCRSARHPGLSSLTKLEVNSEHTWLN